MPREDIGILFPDCDTSVTSALCDAFPFAGMPGTFLYFAYGSNMFARRLAARTPSAVRIATAYVEGAGSLLTK
jgi:hypothetical protein